MLINYVLIDFESVQPKDLEILVDYPFKVFVFVGANQMKVPFKLAAALQELGKNGRYIKISGNGKNALDFHIAYYIGKLSQQDSKASFYIISKDCGFDPLVEYLKSKKIKVQREKELRKIIQQNIT